MSHTPGPWGAAARQGDDWESVVYVPGTPNEICQCFHSSLSLGGKENCEANARLIAAAPEMYEALKDVEWSHHGECPQCGRSQSLGHQPRCILGNALAKAEGRQ